MLKTEQIRAARALLGWNQAELAKNAHVSIATIRRIEGQKGPVGGYVSKLVRIQTALEQASIRFLQCDAEGGIGVRLVPRKP